MDEPIVYRSEGQGLTPEQSVLLTLASFDANPEFQEHMFEMDKTIALAVFSTGQVSTMSEANRIAVAVSVCLRASGYHIRRES